MKGWTPQAMGKASKPVFAAPTARTPAPKGKTQPAVVGEPTAQEKAEDKTPPPAVAAQHYIGPYQLAVANGTHFPGRMRIVVVGPASDALTAALVAALTQFTSKP